MKKITSISKHKPLEVFDMTVENNHNFITHLGILHNCDYRGEIKVKLTQDFAISGKYRVSDTIRKKLLKITRGQFDFNTQKPLEIRKGERIAQGIILPFPQISFNTVDVLSDTKRGSGGFGHTGK